MMQLIMAGALLLLAAARIPALVRKGRDTVFMAAVFAGASSLLLDPSLYLALDPALGGANMVKLALNSFMIVGLWYLRAAVLSAVSPDTDTRPGWVRALPLTLTLALQAIFFFLAGISTSTTAWAGDHRHAIATSLFSLMMIFFIAWSCGQIAWTCFRYVPQMRQSFRVGFSMVGLGCLVAVAVMADMVAGELEAAIPDLSLPWAQAIPVHPFEMVAITLVGVGLTIPPVAGRITERRAAARLLRTIAKVAQIRERALADRPTDRMLEADADALPEERLHRMIVEIWDAELAAGGRSGLAAEDRDYLLLVESDFGLERTQ